MGRFFSMLLLSAVMLCPTQRELRCDVQPVFFSMLFPQLIPDWMLKKTAGEEGML